MASGRARVSAPDSHPPPGAAPASAPAGAAATQRQLAPRQRVLWTSWRGPSGACPCTAFRLTVRRRGVHSGRRAEEPAAQEEGTPCATRWVRALGSDAHRAGACATSLPPHACMRWTAFTCVYTAHMQGCVTGRGTLLNLLLPICYVFPSVAPPTLVPPCALFLLVQGVMKALNVNKLTAGRVRVQVLGGGLVRPAQQQNGGDLKKIQTVGKYMIEVWRAVGMDLERVQFLCL